MPVTEREMKTPPSDSCHGGQLPVMFRGRPVSHRPRHRAVTGAVMFFLMLILIAGRRCFRKALLHLRPEKKCKKMQKYICETQQKIRIPHILFFDARYYGTVRTRSRRLIRAENDPSGILMGDHCRV